MKDLANAARSLRVKPIVVRLVGGALFLLVLLLSVRTNWQHPEWNFDLVGYVAVITSQSESDPKKIQTKTYDAIREGAPRNEYTKLAGSSGYRKALAKRPETLMTQVRLYRNKPAYLAAVSLTHTLGANLARATYIVSLVAYAFLALLLRWWLRRRLSGPWASILCICLMLSHPVFLAARMSAPDMLAALVMVPALLLLLESRWKWGLGLLVMSIVVRPDTVILVGLVCGGLMLRPPEGLRRRVIVGFGIAALAIYAGVGAMTDPYPYRVLLKHSLTTRLFEPARMTETITWAEYVEGLRKSIFVHGYTLYPSPMWLFALLGGLAIYLARRAREPQVTILVLACCGYVALHILLFPVRNDRYFVSQYMFVALAAIYMVVQVAARRAPDHPPAVLAR